MEVSGGALVSGKDILDYIPQRPPIVMVDAFYGVDGADSFCGLDVADGTLFCADGIMDECGVVEHVAQSAAFRIGYLCRCEGRPVPLGFIGSVNGLEIHSLPRAGEKMRSQVTVLQEVANVTLIRASVTADGRPVCDCRMKIVLKDE